MVRSVRTAEFPDSERYGKFPIDEQDFPRINNKIAILPYGFLQTYFIFYDLVQFLKKKIRQISMINETIIVDILKVESDCSLNLEVINQYQHELY